VSAPRVSVVIPAYNAAAFIEATLDTVAAQTFRDFEVLVVDDGSKDDTAGVVDRFLAAKGLRGRAIKQANKKIAGARNTGWRAAGGEWIAFLDHDDAWYPSKLQRTMEEIGAHPEAGLVCHWENVVEKGRVLRVCQNGPWVDGMYERLLFQGNALSPSCVTVRREALEKVGGFREEERFNTVEDYDLWMRLARVCRFHFWGEVLGDYHFEERGASRRIVYHHTNLEHLLRDHFAGLYGAAPGLAARLRMSRRLSSVYRSALGLLATYGEAPDEQRRYARLMLRSCPWDPKNLAKAALWAAKAARR
jgi:glycosyltransferase involved in cell wall biosynthesis